MLDFEVPLIYRTDSYKHSHYNLLPPGSEILYSYMESRGGKYKDVVPFGFQYQILRYLVGDVLKMQDILDIEKDLAIHISPGVFNKAGWLRLLEKHKGKLPVKIMAIPEGRIVSQSQVILTVENTDPEFPWLTNFLETLLMQTWYPITVASQQYAKRKMMLEFLEKTGTPSSIDYKWHDFGYRGVSSQESAAVGGAAHLLSFKGTDTLIALKMIQKFYDGSIEGNSIPASEHSTITSWGRDHELDAYRNMLEKYPTGIIACVSDSYDINKACSEMWGTDLAKMILGRDGILVVRPDSGDPPAVVTRLLKIFEDCYGSTSNDKGYKVLFPKIRLIQGDGINYESAYDLLSTVERKGWSIDNLGLGEGSGNLQQVNRDTLKMAIKCSAIRVSGQWRDVWKDPVTDPGKLSKKGRFALVYYNDRYHTQSIEQDWGKNVLQVIFENGELKRRYSWSEVRQNLLGE